MSVTGLTADLGGQVALVVGGGRGIGQAIAESLAECGARVVIAGRTVEDLRSAERALGQSGAECLSVRADVTRIADIQAMVDAAYGWHERLDILVNSAGVNIPQPSLDVTEAEWDRIIDTNLKGSFFSCQAAARKMIPQGSGRIVNITSQMAFVGYYDRSAYCASKGGVTQFTKVLAGEWGKHGVRVNCVAPTFVDTPMTRPMFEDREFLRDVMSRISLGYVGKPSDIAGAVIYLVSEAANMVTGSTILVDGGWVAW
jgi:NAD(P)-dependent dehydrogenase (short-subunit alcohol dehydrogenase family)